MKILFKKIYIFLVLIITFIFYLANTTYCEIKDYKYKCDYCNSYFENTNNDNKCPYDGHQLRALTASEIKTIRDQLQIQEWEMEGKTGAEVEQKKVLQDHRDFVNMIAEIFSVNNDSTNIDENSNDLFSTYNLMMDIRSALISSLQKFNNSGLYYLFCFIGTLFVIINYSINLYQSSYNFEGKTIEQYLRLSFQIIFSLFLVYSASKFSEFFLNFFGYVLDYVWGFTKSGTLVVNQPTELGFTPAEDIAYKILLEEGLAVSSANPLDWVMTGLGSISLRIKFLIPWLVSFVGKFGILFAILNNAIELLVYCFLLPIAAGDVNENIRQSKIVKFSKHIMASAINLSVIVLIMLAIQVLSNDFLQNTIDKAKTANGTANITQLAFMMAVLQLVKAVSCNSAAKQISSRVFGD